MEDRKGCRPAAADGLFKRKFQRKTIPIFVAAGSSRAFQEEPGILHLK